MENDQPHSLGISNMRHSADRNGIRQHIAPHTSGTSSRRAAAHVSHLPRHLSASPSPHPPSYNSLNNIVKALIAYGPLPSSHRDPRFHRCTPGRRSRRAHHPRRRQNPEPRLPLRHPRNRRLPSSQAQPVMAAVSSPAKVPPRQAPQIPALVPFATDCSVFVARVVQRSGWNLSDRPPKVSRGTTGCSILRNAAHSKPYSVTFPEPGAFLVRYA
jgi:hypothetical protein